MLKKLLIITIILLLTFNSYSAVSVSDGSAFVTKNELSKDLTDISNRVSILENSIEAKIDSQVASYLSRNGIWSGEKQTLNSSNVEWGFGYGNGTRSVTYFLNTTHAQEATTAATGYSRASKYAIIKYGSDKSGNIVDKISKSGLAIIKTSCSDASNKNGEKRTVVCAVRQKASDNGYYAHEDHFRFIYNASVEFLQNDTKLSGVEVSYIAQFAGASLEAPALPSNVLLLFVEKNLPLQVKYKSTLNTDAGTEYSCTLRWFNESGGAESYRTYKVLDISIY